MTWGTRLPSCSASTPWSCRTRPQTLLRAWLNKWAVSQHSQQPQHRQSKSQFLLILRIVNKNLHKLLISLKMSALTHLWVAKSLNQTTASSFQLARNWILQSARWARVLTKFLWLLQTCISCKKQTIQYLSLSSLIGQILLIRFNKKPFCNVTKLQPEAQRNSSYLYIHISSSRTTQWKSRSTLSTSQLSHIWTDKTWLFSNNCKRKLHSAMSCTALPGCKSKSFRTSSSPGSAFLILQSRISMGSRWSPTKSPSEQSDPCLHRYSEPGPTRVILLVKKMHQAWRQACWSHLQNEPRRVDRLSQVLFTAWRTNSLLRLIFFP